MNRKCINIWESGIFEKLIFLRSLVPEVNMCINPPYYLCEIQESMCQLHWNVHCCIHSSKLCVMKFIIVWDKKCRVILANRFHINSFSSSFSLCQSLDVFSFMSCFIIFARSGLASNPSGINKCAKCLPVLLLSNTPVSFS